MTRQTYRSRDGYILVIVIIMLAVTDGPYLVAESKVCLVVESPIWRWKLYKSGRSGRLQV